MPDARMRAFLGFIAAAISVLTVHQGMLALLHALGWSPFVPYRSTPVPPFAVPYIADVCFWSGLYGAAFGFLSPRFTLPLWCCGLILGVIAALIAMFVVAPIKGYTFAYGWKLWPMGRSLLINGVWGIGVGVALPLLMPRGDRAVSAPTAPSAPAGARGSLPH
jgi:hypothetical protein